MCLPAGAAHPLTASRLLLRSCVLLKGDMVSLARLMRSQSPGCPDPLMSRLVRNTLRAEGRPKLQSEPTKSCLDTPYLYTPEHIWQQAHEARLWSWRGKLLHQAAALHCHFDLPLRVCNMAHRLQARCVSCVRSRQSSCTIL